MDTTALTTTDATDETIVALTPAEMPAAQQSLSDWFARKIAALEAEAKDLNEHRAIATANGWKLSAVVRQLTLTRRRITYYGKLQAAVDAGYLIVPNMPVSVFAVRVNRHDPPEQTSERSWRSPMTASAQVLPAGEGRYVGDELTQHREEWVETKDGKEATKYQWISDDYTDVDFPVKTVKPVVLEATARAMALKLFDQFGIVQDSGVARGWGRKGDPIVLGQILDPRGQGRGASYFISWWLDTKDL